MAIAVATRVRRTRMLVATAMALAIAAAPGVAAACAVCFSGTDDASRVAFIDTTIFLTLLPLALLGAACRWAWLRSQVLDREAEQLRQRRAAAAGTRPGS